MIMSCGVNIQHFKQANKSIIIDDLATQLRINAALDD